ncbi:Gfo/Idh/MocA family protein [Brevibacterium casei]|uniref:Predicted dehydrogenase n=2 Tax=Brevibacterium casei TaxID=33889 RepID=A0A2H1IRC4_9MICO|nr:Gfo/Idh/MocA family oxidoreductase [Brevibacterium casei]QPR39745.1 Gfo/Idh/MocA family oxidoreductase [Brevibacterium casei]QPR43909.1 Gfo/Idh/MocA family oxidoreductase [Brevibacterium casei]SMX77779.1 Predicted dehydrogenase [Brevibacterium casei CIP 102111]VEW15458.1 1,5-anhydro-D-fructose reductase [Brevibacterium casei]
MTTTDTTPHEIGVGLISVGWMGQLHSRAYSSIPVIYPELGIRPKLVIAADTNPDRADYAVDVLGYGSGTTDYRDVLDHPGVDVVSVCAPNFLHEEIGTAVARAGKSLWIEKPVGRSAEETQAVADAADAAGIVTAVGFNYRNAPAIEYARRIIAEGQLGRIINVRGAFFADYSAEPNGALSWRFVRNLAGSGVLGDLLGHLTDLAHYVVGPIDRVTGVSNTAYTERPKLEMGSGTHFSVVEGGEMAPVENEDYAGLLVHFGAGAQGAGAVGTLEASRVSVGPRAEYSFEVYGTEGSLRWNFERMNELELALGYRGPHVGFTRIMSGPEFGDFSKFQPGAGTSMGYDDLKVIEAKKFLRAHIGEDSAHADVHDALAANRVVYAGEQAIANQDWRAVEPVEGTSASKRHEPVRAEKAVPHG